MHPTIKDGETVTVEPIEPSDVKRGDIILYKACEVASPVIAHRVVKVNKIKGDITSIILRGDASQSNDAPIAPEQVMGKVVSVGREGGGKNLARGRLQLLRLHVFRLKKQFCSNRG